MVAAYKFRLVCHSSGSSLVSVRSALFAAMEAQQHLSIRLERMAQILEAAAPGDRALLSKSQTVSVVALITSLDRKDRAKWAPMIPNWVDLVASMSGRVGAEDAQMILDSFMALSSSKVPTSWSMHNFMTLFAFFKASQWKSWNDDAEYFNSGRRIYTHYIGVVVGLLELQLLLLIAICAWTYITSIHRSAAMDISNLPLPQLCKSIQAQSLA